MQTRLATTHLAALSPGRTKRDLSDAAVAGLVMRISPNGSEHWLFRFSWKGSRPRIALGRFPAVGLAEARKRAMECSDWLDRGIDPRKAARRHRRELKARDITRVDASTPREHEPSAVMPDATSADRLHLPAPGPEDRSSIHYLAHEYTERYVKANLANAEEIVRILRKDILPVWAQRDAWTIKSGEIIDLLDGIVERVSPVMANRTATYLGQMFKFGIHRSIVEDSPVKLLYRPGGKERPLERALSEEELVSFLHGHAAACVTERRARCLMVLLLTLQRGSELSLAEWREFDFEQKEWRVPRGHSKNRLAHVVPLSDWAITERHALKKLSNGSRYVLPNESDDGPEDPKLLTRSVARLLPRFKAIGVQPFTPRDLKRTGRTNLGRLKVPKQIAELVINHVKEKLEGTYDVYEYLPEKREALEKWSNYLTELNQRPVSSKLSAAIASLSASRDPDGNPRSANVRSPACRQPQPPAIPTVSGSS
jgi:integrase